MTPAMYSASGSELGGWLLILAVTTGITLVLSRRAKVRADRQHRKAQQ